MLTGYPRIRSIALALTGFYLFIGSALQSLDGATVDDAAREAETSRQLLAEAKARGDARRGADVFASTRFGCLTCHKVGAQGGAVGPELTTVGRCMTPDALVESVLWPAKTIHEGYTAVAVALKDGTIVQGYVEGETDAVVTLRDATTQTVVRINKSEIDERREVGTLMPQGLADAMTADERRDLIRFLTDLGHDHTEHPDDLLRGSHLAATFPYQRDPLRPELWPNWRHPVNRDRVYDFYAKEADYFRVQPRLPALLPEYPGLDGGTLGHWGNQSDDIWRDSRWAESDHGDLLCGVFRAPGVTVGKGVCMRLGDHGELSACFNPDTLSYDAVWRDGFVSIGPERHGLVGGLTQSGTPVEKPAGGKPDEPFVYHGFYRHGPRVIFSYRIGDIEMLDAPWAENGQFVRTVGPAASHPLAPLTRGGPTQWPQILETKGTLGTHGPYAVDTIGVPFDNPWQALMFFGDHDFLPDGSAILATITGDVWHVSGLDESLTAVRWKRFASGLNHALGVVVHDGAIYVQGRDQITRLRDLDGDGEADFYECVSNAFITSPAGHDFICGLQRDGAGNFYTCSGNQGLIRIHPDGKTVDVIATGFRNPNGLGLSPDGVLTVPCSEGEWTPASMICEIKPGGSYGYLGPREGKVPDLPLVYLPRGLDNSSGGQAFVPDDRFGPLKGQMIHTSSGAGAYFLVLRDNVDGQPQGAVVPMPGDFLSGIQRARFNPRDGQLYVSGMSGWGSYTKDDGCFQRIRYTGAPAQLPVAFHAHQNGIRIDFSEPLDRTVTSDPRNHFAQCWNYRYGPGYGSPEFSPHHPGAPGHDPLRITAAHVLDDGKSLFLELPELQPVNQLYLRLRIGAAEPVDLFGTVHKLAAPFTGFPSYRPLTSPKIIAAHPILADLASAKARVPNPWQQPLPNARPLKIEAGKNLTFATRTLIARPGEPIALQFQNPDVVPHNWALIKPGTLQKIGELTNKMIAEPDAVSRHYVPKSDDVIAYTDIVDPGQRFTIYFKAPSEPGRYPFLCTFPGHWMIMNGTLIVE